MGVRRRRLPHPPLHNHQLNPHTTTYYTRYTRRIPFQTQPQLYNNNAWNAFPPCVDISERSDSSLTLSVLLLYQLVRRAPLLLPSVIDCGQVTSTAYFIRPNVCPSDIESSLIANVSSEHLLTIIFL